MLDLTETSVTKFLSAKSRISAISSGLTHYKSKLVNQILSRVSFKPRFSAKLVSAKSNFHCSYLVNFAFFRYLTPKNSRSLETVHCSEYTLMQSRPRSIYLFPRGPIYQQIDNDAVHFLSIFLCNNGRLMSHIIC